MRKKGYIILIWLILFPSLLAAQKGYKVINYKGDIYFGHITYLDPNHQGERPIIQSWASKEPTEAILNLPLMPGDTVYSRDGRLELQFDNGTIIRLDRHSELFLQTVLAPTLSSNKKVSNLVLSQGTIYVMYKEYDGSELFQVLTAKSAVKLEHNSVSIIKVLEDGSSEVIVRNGRVWVMVPPERNKKYPSQILIEKGWRAKVKSPLGMVQAELYNQTDDFLTWNEEINANFDFYHTESVLPEPLRHLPLAVYYFAQRYGSVYGEWLWHELYGYVWRPFYNDYYPWGSWMPYFYGRWLNLGGSLFWIPEEPWGWVPYHLGFWMWDEKKGWLWIPGSIFAPSWTVWDYFFGFYAWRPWTLFDWYLYTYYDFLGYNPTLAEYFYRFARQEIPVTEVKPILDKIRKDQLKKQTSGEKLSPPKEVKKITQVVLNALKQGDPGAVESLRQTITKFIMVSKEDFKPDFPREKVLKAEEAFETGKINLSPLTSAEKTTFLRDILTSKGIIEKTGSIKEEATASTYLPGQIEPIEKVGPRRGNLTLIERIEIVDWNPDVRIASRLGYNIVYDSQRNEVRCPELGYGSRDMAFRRLVSFPDESFHINPFTIVSSPSSPGAVSSPVYSGGAERTGANSPTREGGVGRSGEKK
ncbi:MAG: FecR family protein [Candidatus Aminicenantes bacterium]|nr:FecR family protein [Candidatus Aminicenantes bacterium]